MGIYLLQGQSGHTFWYGRQMNDLKKIFSKNLFFLERAYGLRTHHLHLDASKFRLLLEGDPRSVQRASCFLLQRLNREIQFGSSGIFVFSGGVQLQAIHF